MSRFSRLFILVLLLVEVVRPSFADVSAAERTALTALISTNGYSDGLPVSAIPGPLGARIYFLRSGATDDVDSLFMLDTSTGITQKILDPADLGLSRKGLTSFQVSNNGDQILIPYTGKIFILRVLDRRLLVFNGSGYLDPVLSPDGKSIAAVKNNDIVDIDIATGHVSPVTTGGSDLVTNGLPDLVAARDFGRNEGYWWSPDSRYIAFEQADATRVSEVHLIDLVHPDRAPAAIHYPFAGTPNAVVKLGVVPAAGGKTVWAAIGPEYDPYILRVVWRFGKAPLSVVVEARDQRVEEMMSVDPLTGQCRKLLKQVSPLWVSASPDSAHRELADVPYWLTDGSGFLWLTDRRGDWQIELFDADGTLLRDLTPLGLHVRSIDDVDERTGTITFEASQDPQQCQIYRTDFRGGDCVQISHTAGCHAAVFSADHSSFADRYSLTDNEIGTDVFSASTGFRLARLPSAALSAPTAPNIKFFQVSAAPEIDAAALLPATFNAQSQYPVLLEEPEDIGDGVVTQSVHDYLIDQWYADQGFIVAFIDGRGAPDRGRNYAQALKYATANAPLNDQVQGLPLLAKLVPQMDLTRVGIVGDGFGGYLAAMGTIRHPEVFTCGVAESPIIDWGLLDTALAERYLDTPSIDPVGYSAASVLTYAPTVQHPLLVLQDASENSVAYTGSLRLVQELFVNDKPIDYVPYDDGGAVANQTALHLRVVQYLMAQLHP